ncbi:MAG: 4-alpha-glucanotransferase [Methanomicrobiaceae archaeon]|nr:4-alpha-glucanotransferase [Methanomicrobiaceae archaeon]
MRVRRSGVLLPVSSLPSPFGIGDLGPSACRFIDLLADAGQSFWQILPLNPIRAGGSNSPYDSISAFAANPLLISPEVMVEDDLLAGREIDPVPSFPGERVDYGAVIEHKEHLFRKAFSRFREREERREYERFCSEHPWLEDFALFASLKERFGGRMWSEWPDGLRERHPEALEAARAEESEGMEYRMFLQYLFFTQWSRIRQYAAERGVRIIGDMAIYVAYDSADVWAHPEIFNLDDERQPITVAGVPPDIFSDIGQLWGNPVYRWEELAGRGYRWWVRRFERVFELYDMVRIDHFRGFIGYWEIPADETDAVIGEWKRGPGAEFFRFLQRKFLTFPVIAEDLGVITADVREVVREFNFPGIRVLLFAFVERVPDNPHMPHNHVQNCVLYTGTHDNNTVLGWFEQDATPEERERVFSYMGREIAPGEISGEFVRLALMSVADTVIIPIQDYLGLGAEARVNRPGTHEGNWEWRISPDLLTPDLARRMKDLAYTYERL